MNRRSKDGCPRFAALASSLPTLLACTDGQVETEFRITNVAFDNDSTITLTFSQPVAELGGVDPNSFRLSMGRTVSSSFTYEGATETYQTTSYLDLAIVVSPYDDYLFSFMSIERGASADQIILRTTNPLGPAGCDFIDDAFAEFEMYAEYYGPSAQFDVAMFLHHAAGDIPIESEAGEPLLDIGASWALSPDESYYRDRFGFTMLSPQLRIPCP
jgi:hypothetical protein